MNAIVDPVNYALDRVFDTALAAAFASQTKREAHEKATKTGYYSATTIRAYDRLTEIDKDLAKLLKTHREAI